MKKSVSVFLLLCVFLALFAAPSFAEEKPEPEEDWGLPIDGTWGEAIPIHNGVYKPFVLDKRLKYCRKLVMLLSVAEYTGYPFGDWYLYALDLDDNWEHIAAFRIEKEQGDGSWRVYEFDFYPLESFKALSICTQDKNAVFTLEWDIDFYAP